MRPSRPLATGRVAIDAAPSAAYAVVSDPPLMASFAEEAFRAEWLGGIPGPAVGARFRGHNRNGRRRWSTVCTVTHAEPGRRFGYDVDTAFGLPISHWRYDVEPAGDGCVVTERVWLRVPLWFIPLAMLITGVVNRPGANKRNIATTLDRLKTHLES
ncbi:SRPBCC family protein [Actinomadura atramentaria]|uniref:SRPBCC family protein n=1 Tax=Actinomadura atramentaria TaxID=1990 RepID=UPI000375B588|nr:SRPBCC family protein [Actinomadura atramentaria]